MLADFEMAMMMIFLVIMVVFGGTEMVVMVSTDFSVQSEAQVIAMSEGKYGGYTVPEQASVEAYIGTYCASDESNPLNPNHAAVGVSAAGSPVAYGTEVTSVLTVPFQFWQIGKYLPGTEILLTGRGKSISSYIPGVTPDVAYASP
jgi:hypothetical protein